MVKNINRGKMNLLNYTSYLHTLIFVKFENLCKSFIILIKTTIASVLKLVNRQDLKSCGWFHPCGFKSHRSHH